MAGRPAPTTQAAIERGIRAVLAAGLMVVRVVARADGYAIETQNAAPPAIDPEKPSPDIVL